MEPSSNVSLRIDGRVATLELSRPPLNVLDIPTLTALGRAVEEVSDHDDLQLLVVRSGLEKAFSAGVAVEDHTPDKVAVMLESFHNALVTLREMSTISLAAVRGHCLGGGMELALACDLVLAEESARFAQPEVELGCYPPYAAALYPSLIGAPRTLAMLITGHSFSAVEAERMGLVSWLAPDGELDEKLEEVVSSITAKSAAVTALIKEAVVAGRDRPFRKALREAESLYLGELSETEDMQEGLTAFLEKRRPTWKHR